MSREHLYKAKRKGSNKEWIEGYYAKIGDRHFILTAFGANKGFTDFIEVKPDTVCEYTGLQDKNGKKIFENDICKIRFELPDESQNGLYEYCNYKIFWDKEWLKYTYADNESVIDDLGECLEEDLEAIGNIFDNLELLRGEDGNE